jgi:hypothetical protein
VRDPTARRGTVDAMRYLELVKPRGGLYFVPTRRARALIDRDGVLTEGGVWTTIGMPGYFDLDRLLHLTQWHGCAADDPALLARQERLRDEVREIRMRLREEAAQRSWSRDTGLPTSFEEDWRFYAQCLRILEDTLFWARRHPSGTWRLAAVRSELPSRRAHDCDFDPPESAVEPCWEPALSSRSR